MIARVDIARLIPHSGTMCLLDHVEHWDVETIRCVATSHRAGDNPLAERGVLPALAGIEYAAQAMATHGALTAARKGRPRAGYLASLRDVRCTVRRLDELPGDLAITARQLIGGGAQVIYDFSVSHDDRDVLTGRAAVVLDVFDNQERRLSPLAAGEG